MGRIRKRPPRKDLSAHERRAAPAACRRRSVGKGNRHGCAVLQDSGERAVTRLRIWLARVRDALRARQVDRDLRAEISAHLAESTDEFIRLGKSPEAARLAALRSFGGVVQAE